VEIPNNPPAILAAGAVTGPRWRRCYRAGVSGADSERYWDERARENPLYFVDNEVDYDNPDTDAFWRRGDKVVDEMLDGVGLSLNPDDSVLDIGCGIGRITRALASRVKRVYGLDVSSEMLKLAKQHNSDLRNVEWLHGDGHSLSALGDSSVDGCFSYVVFQHIPDPDITLNYVREMGRVLRADGWALFQVSTAAQVHRAPGGVRTRVKVFLGSDRPGRADRSWWGSAVEVADLRSAAEPAGLEVEQVLHAGSQFTTVLARRRAEAP
jgi:SAM-dependent methyltransferase